MHVPKDTVTILRTSCRIVDFGIWYQHLLGLQYIIYIWHHVVANMYCRINRRCWCHSYIWIWLQQVPPKRRCISTNLHGVISQGTEILVVKCTKFCWYKTAGQIMLPHQSQHRRCYMFKALLIISSETLNKTKKT